MTVLLDTGVLFAFLNRDDERHPEARRLLGALAKGTWGSSFVSEYVVDELFTLIRARTRSRKLEEAARSLLPLPTPALVGLRILPVGPERVPAILEVFQRHRERGVSFTDASLLVTLEAFGLDRLVTFDERLAALAPGLPAPED